MWRTLWPEMRGRRRPDRPRHQRRPRPDLGRRADAQPARPPPRRRLARPRRRPRRPGPASTRSRTRSCGPSAASSARRSSTTCAAKSVTDRLARDEPRDYVEAAADAVRPRRAHDRLRAPAGDVQAAAPARAGRRPRARRCSPTGGPSSSCSPARRIRATRTASAWCSTCSRSSGRRRSAAASCTSTTTTSASAARMVRGCDVWLNLPRPPLEASGTSGMKSAVNGGLQLSVLDGWWAEGYDGENGWALPGDEEADHGAQDERDARRAAPAARRRGRARVLRPRRRRASRARGSRACGAR